MSEYTWSYILLDYHSYGIELHQPGNVSPGPILSDITAAQTWHNVRNVHIGCHKYKPRVTSNDRVWITVTLNAQSW